MAQCLPTSAWSFPSWFSCVEVGDDWNQIPWTKFAWYEWIWMNVVAKSVQQVWVSDTQDTQRHQTSSIFNLAHVHMRMSWWNMREATNTWIHMVPSETFFWFLAAEDCRPHPSFGVLIGFHSIKWPWYRTIWHPLQCPGLYIYIYTCYLFFSLFFNLKKNTHRFEF